MPGAYTVRPEGIIRQPALTMPGNATGSEAACTALTGSQIRALCGLGTTDNVTFNTVTATTSVLTPLLNNTNAAALIVGNSTYGVTVPGPALFTSNSGVTATPVSSSSNGGFTASGWTYASFTATGAAGAGGAFVANAGANQGIFTTYGDGGSMFGVTRTNKTVVVDYTGTGLLLGSVNGSTQIASNNVVRLTLDTAGAATFSGDISMSKTSAQGYIRAYATDGVKNVALYDDGTNGILSTSSGNLNLVPTGGTVAVTGDVTANTITTSNYSVFHFNGGTVNWSCGIAGVAGDGYRNLLNRANNGSIVSASTAVYGWCNTSKPAYDATNDTGLARDAAGVVEINNGTLVSGGGSYGSLKCAGITASGAIQETYRTSSLDPTVSDIGSGKRQGWYNTTATEFRDWVNVGGTLYKSAVYT